MMEHPCISMNHSATSIVLSAHMQVRIIHAYSVIHYARVAQTTQISVTRVVRTWVSRMLLRMEFALPSVLMAHSLTSRLKHVRTVKVTASHATLLSTV